MINPQAIVNKERRDIRISMLITKPFALFDDRISKTNDRVSKQQIYEQFKEKQLAKT